MGKDNSKNGGKPKSKTTNYYDLARGTKPINKPK
jgi:hypothetical protein